MAEQPSLLARVKAFGAAAQARIPGLAHGIRMQERVSAINGSVQAGGVTYYGFLSFFPILALAFFAVGYIARVWPDAQENLEVAINEALPGLIGSGSNQISLQTIQDNATTVGLIGLVGVIYAGLGWLSALRSALMAVFDRPQAARPNFVFGKARDLLTLVLLGLALLISVSLSSLVSGFSADLLTWLHWPGSSTRVLAILSILLGAAVSTGLFLMLFVLLARPPVPARALAAGALLAAVAFEALKWASTYLIRMTRDQEAFAIFGIALILLVWINYSSRIVLYGAAWAQTSETSRVDEVEAAESAESADSRALRERVEQSRREPVPARAAEHAATDADPGRGRTARTFLGGLGLGALAALVVGRRLRDR
jgi:membrane protein